MYNGNLSKLHVSIATGELLCGEPDMKSSVVHGGRIEYLNTNDPDLFDYRVVLINSIGVQCHGYVYSCNWRYYMLDKTQQQ